MPLIHRDMGWPVTRSGTLPFARLLCTYSVVSVSKLRFPQIVTCRLLHTHCGEPAHPQINKMLPLVQIVMTAVVCCWAHLMTPADPRKASPVLGVSLPHCSLLEFALCRQYHCRFRPFISRS